MKVLACHLQECSFYVETANTLLGGKIASERRIKFMWLDAKDYNIERESCKPATRRKVATAVTKESIRSFATKFPYLPNIEQIF